jgi:NTE family protein
MTDITLALGGGGSKGYAHLGVIRALLELGFKVQGIAGTSAGGMAGAIYAAGFHPDEVLEVISSVSQENLYGFGRGPGLLNPSGIHNILEDFLGEIDFSDLQIPCALTAVDLEEMTEITIREGKVLEGVKATIAVPGVFPPVEREDYRLVDGMVLNPIPVGIARSLAPRLPVVAVSLSPEPKQWKSVLHRELDQANPLLRPISRLRIAQAFEVFLTSMDMTMHKMIELRLEAEKPAILIRPDVFHIGSLDRVDVNEVARLGDEAVYKHLRSLKKLKRRSRWRPRK